MKDAFDDLQNGTVYRSDLLQCRKLNISNLRIRDSGIRQFGERHMVKILALVYKSLWLITTRLLSLRDLKFTNLLVQLSIFLIDLFVGTYRLSSHARLEAFVI